MDRLLLHACAEFVLSNIKAFSNIPFYNSICGMNPRYACVHVCTPSGKYLTCMLFCAFFYPHCPEVGERADRQTALSLY